MLTFEQKNLTFIFSFWGTKSPPQILGLCPWTSLGTIVYQTPWPHTSQRGRTPRFCRL